MYTILLADDDPDFLDTWGRLLQEHEYNVLLAENPSEARQLLSSRIIDLAVLDLRLETGAEDDKSGIEIATDDAYKHIPKIILSAFDVSLSNVQEVAGYSLGELPPVIAFLNKADGPTQLLSVIRRAIETWPEIRKSTITISSQITSDYEDLRSDSRAQTKFGQNVSWLGFALIAIGIFLAWQSEIAIGIASTTAGVIFEALNALFFQRQDKANERMDKYHKEILQAYWLQLILATSNELPAEKKEMIIEAALMASIDSWLASPRDTTSTQSAFDTDVGNSNDQ